MANRRMGTRLITGTIDFLNLPKAAQALYQQCVNESDDDGIVDARLILRIGNFRKRDLEALISGDYVRLINAEKSIVWVTNWQRYNTIKHGRGTPSTYRDDLVRSVPDIKNALFKPKTGKKCRTNDSVELERESESESEESMPETDVESESVRDDINITRLLSPSGDFFTERPSEDMDDAIQSFIDEYGDGTEERMACIVALKIFRLKVWKPKTSMSLASKFMRLNRHGIKRKWDSNKWQSMLEGFVKSELRESDYDEWAEDTEDDYDELSFS